MQNIKVGMIGFTAALAVAAGGYFYWLRAYNEAPILQAKAPVDNTQIAQYPVDPDAKYEDQVGHAPHSGQRAPPPGHSASEETFKTQIGELIGLDRLQALLSPNDLIQDFVVSVDNALGDKMPSKYSPFQALESQFVIGEQNGGPVLSQANYSRYSAYVDLLNSIDAKKLVDIYVQNYDKFQSAQLELGVKTSFNEKLIKVINNALQAPEVKGEIPLLPNGYNAYADPDLEWRSIVQKILIRMGLKNELAVKRKLREIKKLLLLTGKRPN